MSTRDRDDDALLAAYVDGVGELTRDERDAAERALATPGGRAGADATRALLAELRELPALGEAPDPHALAKAIHAATAALPMRRARWWRWALPIGALAVAAVAAVFVARGGDPTPAHPLAVAPPTPVTAPVAAPAHPPAETALWLGGEGVDIGAGDESAVLDALDRGALRGAGELAPEEIGWEPAEDLAWIDSLDDGALDAADRWLAHRTGEKG